MLPEICGYATRFNKITTTVFNKAFGLHRVTFRRGAFAKVLREQQAPIVACIKHDPTLHVATTANGTLLLSEDDFGLFVRVIPCGEIGAMLVRSMAAGRLCEMSIEWITADGCSTFEHGGDSVHDVTEVQQMSDVCFTDCGAMPGTRAIIVEQ